MLRNWVRSGLAVAAVLAVLAAFGGASSSAIAGEVHATSDLFYNYYVPPCYPGNPGAELYTCPVPTPEYVGHTWITYQPLMPHEFLYQHHRSYVTAHPDCSTTRTHVRWH
jgi:hypothetical protein